MAATIKAEGFIEYSLHGKSVKLKAAGIDTDTVVTAPSLKGMADAFEAGIVPELAACLTSDCLIGCIYLRRIIDSQGNPQLNVFESVQGTDGSDTLPMNVTGVLKLPNTIPGAEFGGLWQVSGLSEASSQFGALTGAFVAPAGPGGLLATAMGAEHLDGDGNGYRFAVVSRWIGGVKRLPPVIGQVTTANWTVEMRTRRTRSTPYTGMTASIS